MRKYFEIQQFFCKIFAYAKFSEIIFFFGLFRQYPFFNNKSTACFNEKKKRLVTLADPDLKNKVWVQKPCNKIAVVSKQPMGE